MKAWRDPCRVATTANIALSGLPQIDGVPVAAGDRVLVAHQKKAADNGIYVAAGSAWARASDARTGALLSGMVVRVLSGQSHSHTVWALQTPDPIVPGSTKLQYIRLPSLAGAANVQWFGAQGDGVTPDKDAIQAALDASGHIYIPPGNYLIHDTLIFKKGHRIEGAGPESTLIHTGSGNLLTYTNATGTESANARLESFGLQAGNGTTNLIELVNANEVALSHLVFDGQYKPCNGLRITCKASINAAGVTADGLRIFNFKGGAGNLATDAAGTGIQVYYDPSSPGAAIGGLEIKGSTINECARGCDFDAGVRGTLGEVALFDSIVQGNYELDVTGSFQVGRFGPKLHLERGVQLAAGANFVIGAGQGFQSLTLSGVLVSRGTADNQPYGIDIAPTIPSYGLRIDNVKVNRAEKAGIRIAGVQGVALGPNYFGNLGASATPYSIAGCTGVDVHDADGVVTTKKARVHVVSGYTPSLGDEVIQIGHPAAFDISTNRISLAGGAAHGLNDGDRVKLFVAGGTIAGALDTVTRYHVVNRTVADFQVSLTPGGAPIGIASVGSGTQLVAKHPCAIQLPAAGSISLYGGTTFTIVNEVDVTAVITTASSNDRILRDGAGDATSVSLVGRGAHCSLLALTPDGARYYWACTQSPPVPSWVTVDSFGAAGDGLTDDTPAFVAALASSPKGGVLLLGPKTYSIKTVPVTSGWTLRGQGNATTIKATGPGTMLQVAVGSPARELALEDLTLDAARVATDCLSGNGAYFESVTIRRCRFVHLDNAHGINLQRGRSLRVEECLFDGAGLATAGGINVYYGFQEIRITGSTFRGLNSGLYLAPVSAKLAQQHVTVEGCTFDFMYYTAAALSAWTGSGAGVTYAARTLTDTAKTFVVEPEGTRGALCKYGYVRALPVRAAGTTGGCTGTQLVATTGTLLSAGIKRGELIRAGNAQAVIVSVESDTIIHVEGWFDQATQQPASVPANGQSFIVCGVLLGRVVSASGTTLNLYNPWADLDGAQVTPAAGTLYEVVPVTNYPIFGDETVTRVRILANTFLRAWTDQVSPFGDECEVASNIIVDGQDYGITANGSKAGKGGRHDIHDNLIVRQGQGGIYLGGGKSLVHDNRIIGWGVRNADVNSPTDGPSAIVINPAGVGASMKGTLCHHNIIDGDGLPEALYGIAGRDCEDVAIEDNYITGVKRHEINLSGSATGGVRIRHRTADVIYTADAGQASGQLSETTGPGDPLGRLFAAPGSRHVDTLGRKLWIKASATDASDWRYVVTREFDPRSVPDLFLWHRADSLSSSPVSSWSDGSGNGDSARNLVQPTAAMQPTWIAADPDFKNQPVVVLDGSDDFLHWDMFSKPLAQPCTWMVVCRQTSGGVAWVVSGVAGHHQELYDNSSSKVEISDATNAVTVPTTGDGFDTFFDQTTVCIAIFNGALSKIFVRNAAASAMGNAGTDSMPTGAIGTRIVPPSFPFTGKIAEIAAWSRVLEPDEISTLLRYASLRYGCALKT